MAASVEQIATVCRANLRPALIVTKQLLQSESSANQFLLSRMNDVLGEIVESNFGASTYEPLRHLYTAIDQMQPELINKCDNLAFYYFARSLAVVLEQAVRQKEERFAESRKEEREDGINEALDREEYGSEKETADKRGEGTEEYGRDEKSTVEEQENSGLSSEWSSPHLSSPPFSPLQSDSPSFSSTISSSSHSQRGWSMLPEEWRAKSQEEMKGLITIQGVSPHIGHEKLASFLEMMGPLAELKLYPNWKGWRTGFAVCRYESEEAACSALDRLHLKVFFGTRVYVTRVRPPLEEAEPEARAPASDAETREAASATDAEAREAASPPLAPSPTDTDVAQSEECSKWDSDDDVTPPTQTPQTPDHLPTKSTPIWGSDNEVD